MGERKRCPILRVGKAVRQPDGTWELEGWSFDAEGGSLMLDEDNFAGWTFDELEQISREMEEHSR